MSVCRVTSITSTSRSGPTTQTWGTVKPACFWQPCANISHFNLQSHYFHVCVLYNSFEKMKLWDAKWLRYNSLILWDMITSPWRHNTSATHSYQHSLPPSTSKYKLYYFIFHTSHLKLNTPTTGFSNYGTVNMLVQAGWPRPLQH